MTQQSLIILHKTTQLIVIQHCAADFLTEIYKVLWHNWSTFAVAFIPGEDAVLYAVTHQRSVDAHVAVTEERAA